MIKPNITPGHWETTGELDNLRVMVPSKEEHACDNYTQIAHVVCGDYEFTHYKQPAANAKAIAALPDLLEALEQVLPDWHSADDTGISNGMIAGEITYGDLRKIKAVLIKAGYTF